MRVRELAEWLGAVFEGDGERDLASAAPLETAGVSQLSFVGKRKAAAQAEASAAVGEIPAAVQTVVSTLNTAKAAVSALGAAVAAVKTATAAPAPAAS